MRKSVKIISLIAALTLGISCVAFAACYNSGEENNGELNNNGNGEENGVTVLTVETDFEALVSEKVSEEGWKTAFTVSNYTNCTVELNCGENDSASNKILVKDGVTTLEFYYYRTQNYSHEYYEISADGTYFVYMDIDFSNGEHTGVWSKLNGGVANDQNTVDWRILYVLCPNFGDFYSKFSYNESLGAYELIDGETVETTQILANYGTDVYTDATVKIINGKLAYLKVTVNGAEEENVITFYYFGTTEINLPQVSD